MPGWPEYEIAADGTVRSIARTVVRRDGKRYRVKGCVLVPYQHPNRHACSVLLSRPGQRTRCYPGALVSELFPTSRPGKLRRAHERNNTMTAERLHLCAVCHQEWVPCGTQRCEDCSVAAPAKPPTVPIYGPASSAGFDALGE